MGSEAPRFGSRLFPDVAQVGIATGTTINQSRLTFSGARGIVSVLWSVQLENAGAVAISVIGLNVTGTAPRIARESSEYWVDAVIGRRVTCEQSLVTTDPPDGSFVEIEISLSAGTVTVLASSAIVSFQSHEPGVGTGPVVTVS